jgi:tRNA threonylcarbamoyladenosine biosynthesis protein TsaB
MTPRVLVAIDASAGPASVALFIDAQLRESRRIDRHGSAEMLAPTIDSMLRSATITASSITDIAVGAGPGSFTGLRVVAALGKGLARGSGANLHAVASLALMVDSIPDAAPGEYIAVLDALRGEWFAQSLTRTADAQWIAARSFTREPIELIRARAHARGAQLVGPPIDIAQQPDARAALLVGLTAVALNEWEPEYGRLAEAQVKWEAAHERALPTS